MSCLLSCYEAAARALDSSEAHLPSRMRRCRHSPGGRRSASRHRSRGPRACRRWSGRSSRGPCRTRCTCRAPSSLAAGSRAQMPSRRAAQRRGGAGPLHAAAGSPEEPAGSPGRAGSPAPRRRRKGELERGSRCALSIGGWASPVKVPSSGAEAEAPSVQPLL